MYKIIKSWDEIKDCNIVVKKEKELMYLGMWLNHTQGLSINISKEHIKELLYPTNINLKRTLKEVDAFKFMGAGDKVPFSDISEKVKKIKRVSDLAEGDKVMIYESDYIYDILFIDENVVIFERGSDRRPYEIDLDRTNKLRLGLI